MFEMNSADSGSKRLSFHLKAATLALVRICKFGPPVMEKSFNCKQSVEVMKPRRFPYLHVVIG